MTDTMVINNRFRGPPESGNGGYTCGRIAQCIEGDARVRLHIPPPLDSPLEVVPVENGIEVLFGSQRVATATPAPFELDVPVLPALGEIRVGSRQFRGFDNHYFPSCFVCGTGRDDDGGLCIYAGPIAGTNLAGALWQPADDLAAADGLVAPEFLWAALDCPGGYSFTAAPDHFILLGELQAHFDRRPAASEALAIVAWEIESDGRKHHVGSALYTEAGECLASARATWIEVSR